MNKKQLQLMHQNAMILVTCFTQAADAAASMLKAHMTLSQVCETELARARAEEKRLRGLIE